MCNLACLSFYSVFSNQHLILCTSLIVHHLSRWNITHMLYVTCYLFVYYFNALLLFVVLVHFHGLCFRDLLCVVCYALCNLSSVIYDPLLTTDPLLLSTYRVVSSMYSVLAVFVSLCFYASFFTHYLFWC